MLIAFSMTALSGVYPDIAENSCGNIFPILSAFFTPRASRTNLTPCLVNNSGLVESHRFYLNVNYCMIKPKIKGAKRYDI
jgi:hypothetical protein